MIAQLNLLAVWAALAPGRLMVRLPWSLFRECSITGMMSGPEVIVKPVDRHGRGSARERQLPWTRAESRQVVTG